MQWKALHQRLTYAAQLCVLAWPWSLQLLVTINRRVMQHTQDMDFLILFLQEWNITDYMS